jgi:4-diphosphocytidyl-2-C-methyl-D-erythritol kinase
MTTSSGVTVRAFAKVNLDLRVVGTLPDGYHAVRTVLQSVHLHDTLTVTPRRGPLVLDCDVPGIPTDSRNLVWKAVALLHQAVRGRAGAPSGLRLTLKKRIPAEAGLGGGSSDAAAALLAVTRVWRLDLDLPSLLRLGARLGADVPFFLAGGTAVGLGRGDDVSPLAEPPPSPIVLVKPAFGISTAEAYRWFDEDGPERSTRQPRRRAYDGWPAWAVDLRNDLQPPVVRRHPRVRHAVAALMRLGARHAAMSGSGSAVFGVFDDAETAAAAQAWLAGRGWWAVRTRTLSRATVVRERRRALAGG